MNIQITQKRKKKLLYIRPCVGKCFFVFVLMGVLCAFSSYADDEYEEIKYKEEIVKQLRDEIQQINSEMIRCEKSKKGWIAATVIGGVGVAATSAGMIAQAVKAKEKQQQSEQKKEQNSVNESKDDKK